jgi:hypothetical protein
VREEDAGGREAGAPSDLKMPLENGRAEERVSRGQASERAVCVYEGSAPSSAAGRRRVPSRRPPQTAPRHNGRSDRQSLWGRGRGREREEQREQGRAGELREGGREKP